MTDEILKPTINKPAENFICSGNAFAVFYGRIPVNICVVEALSRPQQGLYKEEKKRGTITVTPCKSGTGNPDNEDIMTGCLFFDYVCEEVKSLYSLTPRNRTART